MRHGVKHRVLIFAWKHMEHNAFQYGRYGVFQYIDITCLEVHGTCASYTDVTHLHPQSRNSKNAKIAQKLQRSNSAPKTPIATQ